MQSNCNDETKGRRVKTVEAQGSDYSKLGWGRYESRYEKRVYKHAKTSGW